MKYDHDEAMKWLQTIANHTEDDALKQVPDNTLRHARAWLHIKELAKKGLIDYVMSNWYVTEAGVRHLDFHSSRWMKWILSLYKIFRNRSYVPSAEVSELFKLAEKDTAKGKEGGSNDPKTSGSNHESG